jgi:hypothetical protein
VVQARRGIQHHALAFKMNAVAAGGQTLHLIEVLFVAGIAVEFMPGIDQRQRIAIHHGRAGEAAIFILRPFRRQRHRQVFPMD